MKSERDAAREFPAVKVSGPFVVDRLSVTKVPRYKGSRYRFEGIGCVGTAEFTNGRGCFGDLARFSFAAKSPVILIPMANKSLDPTTQTDNFTKCITTAI